MPRPRRLGSSSSLNRSLSRLSSSSSFAARKSNSRIYTCLIAGAFLLFASVAFLQVHLLKAPHGSKLSPLENENSDEDLAAEQASWWKGDRAWVGNIGELDPQTGNVKYVDNHKLGRRMGTVQGSGDGEEGEGGDEEMDAAEGMGDEVDDDDEDDDDDDQDRFDVDIDDRELEEEADDVEEFDFGDVTEKSTSGDETAKEGIDIPGQATNHTVKLGMPEQKQVVANATKEAAALRAEGGVSNALKGGRDSENSVKADNGLGDQDGKRSVDSEGKRKRLEKLGNLFSVPKWVLNTKVDSGVPSDKHREMAEILEEGTQGYLVQNLEKNKGSFFWDHALGVKKRALENVENMKLSLGVSEEAINLPTVRTGGNAEMRNLVAGDGGAAKAAMQQLRGFKEVVENWKERFNSDDEPVDENVQRRLDDVNEIEDALLLNGDGAPFKQTTKTPAKKSGIQSKKARGAFDPMNPANIPMLQDPDTSPGTWMTKSDKAMLRAIRVDSFSGNHLSPKTLLRGNTPEISAEQKPAVGSQDKPAKTAVDKPEPVEDKENNQAPLLLKSGSLKALEKRHGEPGVHDGEGMDKNQKPVAQSSGASLSTTASGSQDGGSGGRGSLSQLLSKPTFPVMNITKQWGYYPGIDTSLPFSDFMDQFLGQESCSLRVFMAWTTPAWAFTARHQRVLESVLRIHRNACVVVFSETMELNFFKTLVKDGYKVTVVRPNLDVLLADTQTAVFTSVWQKWRKTPFFSLHYTELLRLAALYKYGGVYMDMDVIVLKPLDTLHNTVGTEIAVNGELRLNGAILAFNKSSLFLKKCMEEFTATYDENLLEWNGADLLTRVANSTIKEEGKTWRQFPDLLKIQGPFSFFPLDSNVISRYFAAPKDDHQKQQQRKLLTRILNEAHTIHLWSRLTSNLVPEIDSLVGTILSRSCLRCADTL